ncbi:MAG: FAD-dependent thymidylate synthase [Candidatus Nanoarchaeia archaeon]|nr:FAD-dependent thymidylate synthase [Candidatus Nanoarchaeia archaeon]MDD5238965.1 FAD-dependent thymidylate synthase [Candidatus Nanoarchaeia archaeon]
MDNKDILVLNHFFTNTDKPIFFVKNMHPEIWALMQARYSRAKEGMRESFLNILKEDPENFEAIARILQDKESSISMDKALDKAIKFMDKWVLGYGHASVAEGAVVGVALEGVSIIATKIIEDNRLCSFIEKSTRYVQFDRNSFMIPEKLKKSKYGNEIEKYIDELFDVYTKMREPVLGYVKKSAPLKPGESESAWERACNGRTFDAIRYILPACTKTSLGWTVNARNLAHGISKLLSYPLDEMKEIGRMLKSEGGKVLPSLLKYADEKKYYVDTEREMRNSLKLEAEPNDAQVILSSVTHDPLDITVAAILYRIRNHAYNDILDEVKHMANVEKEKIIDMYLSKMSDFDWPMRELEHVYLTWDILMDYGAFRDLQRHRICTQTNALLTTFNGYSTPPDIIHSGMQHEFDRVMRKAEELYKKLYKEFPYEAQYIIPLGYRKRFLFTGNLREMYHFIRLRTTPQAHFSYRDIARKMYITLKEKYPLLSKYIVCNMSDDELGRLKSELKFQEKVDKGLI